MYIETDNEKLYAAIRYMVNGMESDHLSESDMECLESVPMDKLEESLIASEIQHIEKYGRPITGSLYLGEKETTIYNDLLVKRIHELSNVEEIIEYLRG